MKLKGTSNVVNPLKYRLYNTTCPYLVLGGQTNNGLRIQASGVQIPLGAPLKVVGITMVQRFFYFIFRLKTDKLSVDCQ